MERTSFAVPIKVLCPRHVVDDDDTNGSGQTQYSLHDANFNVSGLCDANGAVIERYDYKPYGELDVLNASYASIGTSTVANPYTYTGRRFDDETGLYYYRNRYYDSQLGRFISRDPIGYEGSRWNLFEYVSSRPLVFVDPSGLKTPAECQQDHVTCREAAEDARLECVKRGGSFDKCVKEFVRRTLGCTAAFLECIDESEESKCPENKPDFHLPSERCTDGPDPLCLDIGPGIGEVLGDVFVEVPGGLIVVGGGIVVGTVAADFASGGVSLLDDPVTVTVGCRMMYKGAGDLIYCLSP